MSDTVGGTKKGTKYDGNQRGVGALLGAILSAVLWSVVTINTGYEIGWLAWGVGASVGGGAKLLGGEGKSTAIMCAVLATIAILGGKAITVQYFVSQANGAIKDDATARAYYDEVAQDAADFKTVLSKDDFPAFMVSHGYSDADRPEDVSAEELDDFEVYSASELRKFNATPPTFEEWRASEAALVDIPFMDLFKTTLGLMDIVFFALGIATAYRIGLGDEDA